MILQMTLTPAVKISVVNVTSSSNRNVAHFWVGSAPVAAH